MARGDGETGVFTFGVYLGFIWGPEIAGILLAKT